jgi:hypothetical protein
MALAASGVHPLDTSDTIAHVDLTPINRYHDSCVESGAPRPEAVHPAHKIANLQF